MTKASYTEAVLAGLAPEPPPGDAASGARAQPGGGQAQAQPAGGGAASSGNEGGNGIIVRLLLSIDRREGPEAAMETVGGWLAAEGSQQEGQSAGGRQRGRCGLVPGSHTQRRSLPPLQLSLLGPYIEAACAAGSPAAAASAAARMGTRHVF